MCHLRPEEDQSIWLKRRQGFQPCCEAGIREPTLSEFVDNCKQRNGEILPHFGLMVCTVGIFNHTVHAAHIVLTPHCAATS